MSITDNDITPSLSDFTDFGSTTQGAAAVQHTFTVRNDGTSTLTTSELTLPAGFTLIEGLSASIAAGDSDAFTVQLDTASVGTKNGHITFTTNDSDEGSFNFFITGMITNATWPLFTDNNDLFSGLGSNELLHALAGNDYLGVTGNLNQAFGDAGTDQLFLIGDQNQLYGSEGDDWVGVNGNNNALFGGAGNEVWIGASGMSNTLVGGDGGDALFAYGTGNGLYGEGDTDWLGVSGNSNALYGGAGNEWMGATGNSNYLLGGDGGDTLLSVGGNFVYGEAGNDWVGCSGNNNYLNGAQGNDCIAATGNGNTLDGGAGNDTLVAGAHAGDRFVFHPGYGMDSITNFSGHGAGGTDVIDLNGFGLELANSPGLLHGGRPQRDDRDRRGHHPNHQRRDEGTVTGRRFHFLRQRGCGPPITGMAACCASAASGHVGAAPPSSVMNSRRFTRSPRRQARAMSAVCRNRASWRS